MPRINITLTFPNGDVENLKVHSNWQTPQTLIDLFKKTLVKIIL